MKLIYTILIQVFLLANIHSQNVITAYTETINNVSKVEYSYDEQGRLTERIVSLCNGGLNPSYLRSKNQWVYENDRLVLMKKYDSSNGIDWRLSREFTYIYNEEGCVTSLLDKLHIAPSGIREINLTVVNEYDCSDPWKSDEGHSILSGYFSETLLTRRRTENSELEIYEEYDELAEEMVVNRTIERKYNQRNELIEIASTNRWYQYGKKDVYIYDDAGEKILRRDGYSKAQVDSEWVRSGKDEYLYEESLLRKIITSNSQGEIWYIDSFDYYCDGVLKKKTRSYVDNVEGFSIRTYEYDQKSSCPEKCEQLENLSLNIYPNPVKDVFFIESDVFQKESSEVLIYNTIGKLIYRHPVKKRSSKLRINLNPLRDLNQVFIVRVVSEGGHSISKKVMIEK